MRLKNNKSFAFVSGLCLPVASFIYVLLHPKSKSFKMLFVMFFTFVGLAFYYSGFGADVTRYVADFEYLHLMEKIGFFEYFNSIPDRQQIDYYSVFMQWLISRFTGNAKIYLGLLAMVYSMFFAANVEYVTSKMKDTRLMVLLVVLLVCTPKMTAITHRWWTALQVFLFGALPVIFEKKYFRLIWCFITPVLLHFSFVYPLILLVLSIFLPKKVLWPYLLIFIICNLVRGLNLDVVIPFVERFLPELTADRTLTYINAEEVEQNFFATSAILVMNIVNVILAVWIYFKGKPWLKGDKTLVSIYVVSLLIGSFAMIANQTEWGGRYLNLSNVLFVVLYIYFLSIDKKDNSVDKMFLLLTPCLVYVILFQLRGFLSIIGPYQLIAGNYFTTWFLHDTTSVLSLIKHI